MNVTASNITIEQSLSFGNVDYETIQGLLNMVDNNMSIALEIPPFSTCHCITVYKKEHPMCSKLGNAHLISLSVEGDYWCQWVYQFAHEYCHHLINGALTGEWSKLLWFEETVCELSSLYNLLLMESYCDKVGLNSYTPGVKKYLEDLLRKNTLIYKLSQNGGWLKQYENLLSEGGYHRELYNAIAVRMFPLFINNPKLWKMILHIGDIRQWNCIDNLFDHLQTQADASYAASLKQLRVLFS